MVKLTFSLLSIPIFLAPITQAIRITYPTTGSFWVDQKYNPLIWQSESGDPPLNSFHAVLVNITEMQREAETGWNHGVTAYSPTGVGVFYPPDQWPHGMETANISDSEWACYLHTSILQGTNIFQINLTSILAANYGEVLAYSQPFSVKLPGADPELPNDPASLYVEPTNTAIADDFKHTMAGPIASQPARVTNPVGKADISSVKSNSTAKITGSSSASSSTTDHPSSATRSTIISLSISMILPLITLISVSILS